MIVELPYPHKSLWPNGRAHHMAQAREVKKHREWAITATAAAGFEARQQVRLLSAPIPVTITVYGKPSGPLPDSDNCVAAAKSLIDGIAYKLDLNDRDFAAPKVVFAPERKSLFVIEIGGDT